LDYSGYIATYNRIDKDIAGAGADVGDRAYVVESAGIKGYRLRAGVTSIVNYKIIITSNTARENRSSYE